MAELNVLEITITCLLGYPMTEGYVTPNGIGSMPVTIAVNGAWIWSVLKLKPNTNGLKEKWEVKC